MPGGVAAIFLISCVSGMASHLARCGGAFERANKSNEGSSDENGMSQGGSAHSPLTPVGYCYLCLSQFGLATQVAVLLLAYNPSLSVEDLQHCLRLDSRAAAEYVWQQVRAWLEEEAPPR
jgi:hypothetical protein